MKFLLQISALAAATALASSGPASANGVALCIHQGKNQNGTPTDEDFFLEASKNSVDDERDGYDFDSMARERLRDKYGRKTPSCKNSARNLENGGYFVIVRNGNKTDTGGGRYTRYALGFGTSHRAALIVAKKSLQNRDWGWYEARHGLTVVDSGRF